MIESPIQRTKKTNLQGLVIMNHPTYNYPKNPNPSKSPSYIEDLKNHPCGIQVKTLLEGPRILRVKKIVAQKRVNKKSFASKKKGRTVRVVLFVSQMFSFHFFLRSLKPMVGDRINGDHSQKKTK